MLKIIIYIASVLVLLGIIIAIVIVTSKNKKLNKMSEIVYELLPNLDCKQCGRPNCLQFAEDLSKGKTAPNKCPYLKGSKYLRLRQVLKRERKVQFDQVAFVRCKGGVDCNDKFSYIGDKTCSSMNLLHSGSKYCPNACLGCGDCVKSCVYGAISISEKGCAIVDKEKCVGCAECVYACPNHIIDLIPSKKFVEVVCSNTQDDSVVVRNCKVACTHCEACVVACPVGAIKMVGGTPKIDSEICVRCGKCVAACPEHVISRI